MNRLLGAVTLTMAGLLVGVSCGGESRIDGTTPTSTVTTVPAPSTSARTPVTHDFVIPAGTAASVDAGKKPEILPRNLTVHVGDRIRVRNDDTEIAYLGIFDVRPGETVSMSFNKVGKVTGVIMGDDPAGCGSPPPSDKAFTIDVRA